MSSVKATNMVVDEFGFFVTTAMSLKVVYVFARVLETLGQEQNGY